MGLRAEDEGTSEGRPVMGRIGGLPHRETGLTSLRGWHAWTLGQPSWGAKQICRRTARVLLVRLPLLRPAFAGWAGCWPQGSNAEVADLTDRQRVPSGWLLGAIGGATS